MEDEEVRAWLDADRRRAKCLRFLRAHTAHRLPNVSERLQEIHELESLLGDLWKRLEMDARKGDPAEPLRHTGATTRRWLENAPLAWALSTLMMTMPAEGASHQQS